MYESYKRDFGDLLSDYESRNNPTSSKSSTSQVKNPTPNRVTRSTRKSTAVPCSTGDDEEDTSTITYKKGTKERLENLIENDFAQPDPNRREGNSKLSYNYMLLDSRKIDKAKTVDDFADSIIYVGKGKNNRAYEHTKEAKKILETGCKTSSPKINKIVDVWKDEGAVMILKTAKYITAEEAFTREAFMIDALRDHRKGITNKKGGEYYGEASTMTAKEKRDLGIALLVDAKKTLDNRGAIAVFKD